MRLGVNIDHVATIRQARRAREPEPVTAAALAELAGADGITIHLRGDRRHIQDRDLRLLCEMVSTRLNVEMAATDAMVAIATELTPDQVTLVPEHPNEVTTTGGLDIGRHQTVIADVVSRLQTADIAASLFIDAAPDQIALARTTGATAVEINTGPYADANPEGRTVELARVQQAARKAHEEGLEVLGGHGLTYTNVKPVAAIPEIVELNIGHSIVSRAVLVGLERAVREMIALLG
ncbi:MAG: pyridoxine 5'-phosphate synthase [Vicinamibacterales bacterium]|jgi:pyridoxine 5-phosphate synthase|nr:pyridoxine 5'-phosphate synthase [Vicinamibacterales bacterium]|tara:strand:+ start:1841 stop:2548 length:708 start_codon:yes stop_codon:yes gene_type:complete